MRSEKTVNELAGAYDVHPNQVANWKREAQAGLVELFSNQRMTAVRRREGYIVNRQRVLRLRRELGLPAIYPKANLSTTQPG